MPLYELLLGAGLLIPVGTARRIGTLAKRSPAGSEPQPPKAHRGAHHAPHQRLELPPRPAVGCRECHVIDGAGTNFGPDLSRIGDKLSKVGLYESILDPSGGISPSYALYDLTLRDSREVSGFIVSETPVAVTLQMQGGVVSDFAKSEVLARGASSLSAMPSDLQRQMSVDDLVDLVEYMTTLR